MALQALLSTDEHREGKPDEEDDEIDIVGIKTEEIQMNEQSKEFVCDSEDSESKNTFIVELEAKTVLQDSEKHSENVQIDSENVQKEIQNSEGLQDKLKCEENVNEKQNKIDSSISETPECNLNLQPTSCLKNENQMIDDDSPCLSMITSTCSSRVSSRRNSLNDSEMFKNADMDFEIKEGMFGDGLLSRMSDDDDDEFKQDDPYERFFFESDYLALKDNKHYHLLLQTLVALEGQRIQAIKDLDTLYEEQAKALDDPIEFVEKLQNNEPSALPTAQNIIKLPKIPWEVYATSIGPVDTSLPIQYHTRASATSVEKDQNSVVQSTSTSSTFAAPQEAQPTNLFTNDISEGSTRSNTESDVIFTDPIKSDDLSKLPTFNQPWTTEEQTRLEKLLQAHPQEDIESKRWEKIAKALGNRTPKQVASRVQKYFIKLAKAGLPIPGRIPNIPRSGSRISKRSSHYKTMGFRNSTFFPSYQPRVYMDDNRDDDDEWSLAFSDDASCLSDDDSIPEELKQTHDYMQLVDLKRIKRQMLRHGDGDQQMSTSHTGFMCDECGITPIVGSRWHCQDCPQETSVDFCSLCVERGIPESRGHSRQHRLEPITKAMSFFVDGDYVGITGSAATGYNYLDPNFLPAAS